ncbi:MAG TPA: hypothetical protein VLG93_05085 [Sulfuricaulis sp.]|nr:hypothetical protein [Sulfuricaulis sp.]
MILAVMFLVMALSACGEKQEVKDTVFGSQAQMKDKARAVEDKLREGAEKNREALKASEQDDGAEQQKGY